MTKLPLSFYQRSALQVAPELLGKVLVTCKKGEITSGVIVEVEAYTGEDDPASHVYQGRKTPRTRILYEAGGRVYVYRIYGIYTCLNVVTGEKGQPHSVFIRALEPREGIEVMKKRRGTEDIRRLTSGPARLTQALGIDMNFYGESLTGERIFILDSSSLPPHEIATSPRINIDYAGEGRNLPYRFYLKNSPFLSRR